MKEMFYLWLYCIKKYKVMWKDFELGLYKIMNLEERKKKKKKKKNK